jgi:GTP-binding protein
MLKIDEPTLTMNFMVNSSPLAGREGKFVTTRQIRDRLERELKSNMALRVVQAEGDDSCYEVSGRGELHLTILIENMRREGFELAVSRPRVVFKMVDGVRYEPYENLTVDVEETIRAASWKNWVVVAAICKTWNRTAKVVCVWNTVFRHVADRLQGEFMTLTRGTGLMSHVFDDYAPVDNSKGELAGRRNGVLISQEDGAAVAYAIWKLQDRGRMFVSHNDPVYEGMIIGIHSRDNDLVVNPVKGKTADQRSCLRYG